MLGPGLSFNRYYPTSAANLTNPHVAKLKEIAPARFRNLEKILPSKVKFWNAQQSCLGVHIILAIFRRKQTS